MRQTHCKHGHELFGDNLYVSPKGSRGCRKCRATYAAQSHRRNPELTRQYGRDWMRKQRKDNPGRLREYHLRKDYNMSLVEFNKKLDLQDHCCMICRRIMSQPFVDHDHATGQVRDLLCRECNSTLGFIREDVEIAQAIILYLQKWKPDASIKSKTS